MNTIVIYDSQHGNTEQIARMIGKTLDAEVQPISTMEAKQLVGRDLIVIGSPTHGGFPTEEIHKLVKDAGTIRDQRTAAFDTRTKKTVFGYAAPKMGRGLQRSGAVLIAKPEGFFVSGIKGPLLEGELKRAAVWAEHLKEFFSS